MLDNNGDERDQPFILGATSTTRSFVQGCLPDFVEAVLRGRASRRSTATCCMRLSEQEQSAVLSGWSGQASPNCKVKALPEFKQDPGNI